MSNDHICAFHITAFIRTCVFNFPVSGAGCRCYCQFVLICWFGMGRFNVYFTFRCRYFCIDIFEQFSADRAFVVSSIAWVKNSFPCRDRNESMLVFFYLIHF